ncbi:MAG: hypothetical protein JXB09_01910 [Deltaproteobacteria bacterium]|nr:hypothetical protein [Deltaproteobacteria bacterium]
MFYPELSFRELFDLKKSCKYLFPEKRFSEIDNDFLGSLNTDLLRRTYRERMLDCHPDRLGMASDFMIQFKTRECQQVNEAYARLKRFVQERNEWINTVLTSYNSRESHFTNGMSKPQSNHDRAHILERLKRHIHPFVSSFKGFFREMPRESARPM